MGCMSRMLRHQFAVSRNLNEPWLRKVHRGLWAAVFLLKGIGIALRAVRREQLGSQVVYRGRKCFVCNWAGSSSPTLSAAGFYEENCPRGEILNVFNVREAMHRFRFGLGFYLDSWHSIDVNGRVYGRQTAKCPTI